ESSSNRRGRVDWWGALMAVFGLGGLVFGFIESAQLGWRNPLVVGSLLAGIVCLVGFLFIEAREASPMVPLNLFRSRAFSGANLLTVLLYAAIGIFFFLLPLDLIQVQGYSATDAGAAVLPLILLMFLLSRWSGGLVARYGARLPLTVGPLIAALGFLLFSIPSIGGSYWRTFFPAVVVLGFGMAVSVAPWTTVVMGSIDPDRAGTASGINNAVARVAGLLAIAVFGVVMVTEFGSHLNRALSNLSMPDSARSELRSNETKLAALKAPAGVEPAKAAAIESSILASFVSSFRLIMWICAALAVGSAVAAWRMILGSAQSAPAPRLSNA